MNRIQTLVWAMSGLIAASALAGGTGKSKKLDPHDPEVVQREGVEMVSLQLLVKFKSENAALERQKIFKKFGGFEVERVGTTPLFLVQFAEGTDILEVKSKIEHAEGVDYAEPNMVLRALPNKSKKQL